MRNGRKAPSLVAGLARLRIRGRAVHRRKPELREALSFRRECITAPAHRANPLGTLSNLDILQAPPYASSRRRKPAFEPESFRGISRKLMNSMPSRNIKRAIAGAYGASAYRGIILKDLSAQRIMALIIIIPRRGEKPA